MATLFNSDPNAQPPTWASPLLSLGTGLLSGNTWNQQIANAGLGVQTALQSQQQLAQTQATKNKTIQMLQAAAPDLAAAVQAGAMTPTEGFAAYLKKQQDAAEAAKPKYQVINGKLIQTNAPEGIKVAGDFSDPTANMPASAQEYEYAQKQGFKGSFLEYQKAKANMRPGTALTINPDGTVSYTEGVSNMPKLTMEEGKNAGFLIRAQDAEKTLTALEGQGTYIWNKAAQKLPLGIGNYTIEADAQRYNQAKLDFITATLRKESGAVISDDDFSRADQQYFPQPGDTPDVIEQKRQNRQNVIEGFKFSSGPAASAIVPTDRVLEQPKTYPDLNLGKKTTTTINGKPVTIERVE